MDDDSYRLMLKNIPALGGKTSAKDVGINGLRLILDALKSKGFKIKSKTKTPQTRPLADDAQSRKIRSLWLELHGAGIVNDANESALNAYVRRITGVEALQWLNSVQGSRVIETLKKWRDRGGNNVK
jgi:phage gp16-like protein